MNLVKLVKFANLSQCSRLGDFVEFFHIPRLLEFLDGEGRGDFPAPKGGLDEIGNHANQHLRDDEVLARSEKSSLCSTRTACMWSRVFRTENKSMPPSRD